MATGNITVSTAGVFIPEDWQNEVRAYREAKLVAGNLVKRVDFVGQKGDILHIPALTEMGVRSKDASTDVTYEAFTEGEFTVTIDRHRYAGFLIEDLPALQSKYDLRSLYTKNAGYAIAKDIDSYLLSLGAGLGSRMIGSTGATAWDGSANSNTGNGTDLAEAGIRRAIERLDTSDVPDEDRYLVIHPVQKNVLLAIARFTEYQMLGPGGIPIKSGQFGEIFGVQVFVTTRVPQILAVDASTAYHENLLFHKDAFLIAVQMNPRVQAQYDIDKLGWKVVIDNVFKEAEYRDDHANTLISPVL